MKILILIADSNGAYPVPASKGGAVATLTEYLVEGNNKKNLCDLEIITYYDYDAYQLSKKYPFIRFTWIKVPKVIKILDKCAFDFIRTMKKKEKAISFRSPFSLLFYIWKSRRIIKQTDADKIVLENNIPLALTLKGTKYRGEWFYHLHNVPRIDGKCRDVMAKTTKFLCVSQFVAEKICSEESAIGKIPVEKTTVLFNCIDISSFCPIQENEKIKTLRKKYEIEKDDKILIFTGRLNAEKGVDILLEAMTKLPSNVKALIVGSNLYNVDVRSDYYDRLRALSNELLGRVIFTGYVQHDELPYFYNLADLAVLPSMWEEPAGLTNLEAMACGIPTITTDSGGIREYVGESIKLKRDGQIADNLAIQIQNLLNDPEKVKALSEYGLKLVRQKFNKDFYIDEFLRCLREE